LSFPLLEDCLGSVYIGPNPPQGVMVSAPTNHYIIPGEQSHILQLSCNHNADCFLEVTVTVEIAVDESISNGLANNEEFAKEHLLDEAENRKEMLSQLIDTICGLIGLKFHRQFVLNPILDNSFIASGPEPIIRFVGDYVELLQPIKLTKFGLVFLETCLESLKKSERKHYDNASRILQWLLRAWRERDQVDKFLYLFIPLECVLGSSGEMDEEAISNISILQGIVETSEHSAKKTLLSFLDRVQTKFGPTLSSRFEFFAKSKKIEGWEDDVKAFKKFNRMRNLILHAGRSKAQHHLKIKGQTVTLEDLVERYVSMALFGSTDVYQSRWRPKRDKGGEAVA
jgi:hypothetical protein